MLLSHPLVVSGKTFDTVYRNVFGPLTDPAITGELAGLVSYTAVRRAR
jgi:hypothetical protein